MRGRDGLHPRTPSPELLSAPAELGNREILLDRVTLLIGCPIEAYRPRMEYTVIGSFRCISS